MIRFECSERQEAFPLPHIVYISYHSFANKKKEKRDKFYCDDKGFIDFHVLSEINSPAFSLRSLPLFICKKYIIRLTITVIMTEAKSKEARIKRKCYITENTYLTRNLKSNVTYLTLFSWHFFCRLVHDMLPNNFAVRKQFSTATDANCDFCTVPVKVFRGMKNVFMNINSEIWIHLPFRREMWMLPVLLARSFLAAWVHLLLLFLYQSFSWAIIYHKTYMIWKIQQKKSRCMTWHERVCFKFI